MGTKDLILVSRRLALISPRVSYLEDTTKMPKLLKLPAGPNAGPCFAGIKAPFNYSATGALTSGTFGGDASCGTTGCSDNMLSLTFQSQVGPGSCCSPRHNIG